MPTLGGPQMNTSTDSLSSKLLSNFFELYSKCFELHDYGLQLVVGHFLGQHVRSRSKPVDSALNTDREVELVRLDGSTVVVRRILDWMC